MWGVLFAVLAGAAMSVQGVMNTRLQEGVGLYEANVLVQGLAFMLSLLCWWWLGQGSIRALGQVPWPYWFGGLLGVGITLTVMLAIRSLNPTVAIAVILIAQLAVAACIDGFGWMGAERLGFGWQQFVGLALMTGGVVLFKL